MGSGQQIRYLQESLCQSEFFEVQHRDCNQGKAISKFSREKSRILPIVKNGAWENIRSSHCLATVALNCQLDKALWSNLETRSQRIFYIGTLLYIRSPLIPTTDLPFELAAPLRASWRIENGDMLGRPFSLMLYVTPLRHRHLPLSFRYPILQS